MSGFPRRLVWWTAYSLAFACSSSPATPQGRQQDSAVVSWNRDGGFAGFCDRMTITASGDVTASTCRTPDSRTRRLPGSDLTRLDDWRRTFGSVTITSGDSGTADGLTLKLTFAGTGQQQPSTAQRQEMLDWAQRVYNETKS